MDDSEQLERIRAKAYAIVEANPSGPNADQARRILSKLPKVSRTRDPFRTPGAGRGGMGVHGELASSDLSELPPTPDEEVGIESGPQGLTLPEKAAITAAIPSNRRQFLRGADDMLTFGLGQKASGAIGRALGDQPDVDLGATETADVLESPNARGYGQLGAALTGRGLTGLAGRGALKLTAPIATAGKGMLGNTILGGIRGGVANEMAMPVIAGGQAAVRGENPLPVMQREALNPVNAAAGVLLGLPAGASRGIRETGQTGRDIRLVEQYGSVPSRIGRGPQGGVFETPFFQSLEGTAAEQGQASRRAAEQVMGGIEAEGAALSREYGASKAAARDAGWLEGKIQTDAVRQEADKLIASAGLTSSERSAIQREVLGELDKYPGGMSVDDFNDFRGKLGRIFGTGPGDAAVPALDRLRQSAKRTVDETEMGPINEAYSKGRERISRQHEQLGLNEGGRRDINERRLANVIQRRANDEAPGTGIAEAGDLGTAQFLKENPQHAPMLDTARLLAAKERLTGGVAPQGGFFRRVGGPGLLEKNLEPALAAMYRLGAPSDQLAIPAALAARLMLGGQE